MSQRTVHSVTFTARERAELVATQLDDRPLGPVDVEGRSLATLVSAGTELAGGFLGSSFPRVPGYAAIFEVERVGEQVESVRPGDRVFCMGGHRSYQRVTEDRVLMVPPGLAAGSATFCRLMGVSMSTLTTTAARPPAQVVVMGQGLVGHLAARIFARCGYHVAACDPSEVRRRIAEAAGIRALPSAPLGNPEFQDRVALVLECSGHEQGALDGCKLVRKKGEVVLIGTPWRQQTELSAHAITHAVFHRYVVLRSGWEWELPHQPADFRANSLFENYAAALRWLAAGEIDVEPLYSLVPPREAQRAYEELLGQRTERLAVVFDWTDCP